VASIVREDATVRHFGYLSASERDALFESPPDLIPCEVHGLVEARNLRDLFERLWTFAQARDGALVKVAPGGDPSEREPAF